MRYLFVLSLLFALSLHALSVPKVAPKTRRVEYKIEVAYPQLEGFYNQRLQRRLNIYLKEQIDGFWPDGIDPKRITERRVDYVIALANQFVLSVKIPFSLKEGQAANTLFGVKSVNVDLKSGDEITLFSLFEKRKSLTKLTELVHDKLKETRGLFEESLKPIRGTQKYYLTQDALVIYFNPAEVAPRVTGVVEIPISYKSIKDLLHPSFKEALL